MGGQIATRSKTSTKENDQPRARRGRRKWVFCVVKIVVGVFACRVARQVAGAVHGPAVSNELDVIAGVALGCGEHPACAQVPVFPRVSLFPRSELALSIECVLKEPIPLNRWAPEAW